MQHAHSNRKGAPYALDGGMKQSGSRLLNAPRPERWHNRHPICAARRHAALFDSRFARTWDLSSALHGGILRIVPACVSMRSNVMSSRALLRLAFSTIVAAGLCFTVVLAQSQDSQSVAEAARRAREQKKAVAKPAKVITDEDMKHATPESGGAQPSAVAPAASAAPGTPGAAEASGAPAKDEKTTKEITDLKEQIKQAQSDLDLLKQEQALQQDTYYSNPDYVHDTAGKAKLDGIKQQVSDKQDELDKLKARLAELGGTMDNPAAAPTTPPPAQP
jgi:hypothetical protein